MKPSEKLDYREEAGTTQLRELLHAAIKVRLSRAVRCPQTYLYLPGLLRGSQTGLSPGKTAKWRIIKEKSDPRSDHTCCSDSPGQSDQLHGAFRAGSDIRASLLNQRIKYKFYSRLKYLCTLHSYDVKISIEEHSMSVLLGVFNSPKGEITSSEIKIEHRKENYFMNEFYLMTFFIY